MHFFNLSQYYLAQVNTAKVRFPLDDPRMADFVAQIRSVNVVADADPGFVWRLRGEGAEDATDIRPFEDERILITPYAFPFNKSFSARDAIEFELPTPVLI